MIYNELSIVNISFLLMVVLSELASWIFVFLMANKQIKEKEKKYGKSLYKAEIVKIPRSSKGLRLSAQIS